MKKDKFCVCMKGTSDKWFVCDTYQEAREWILYAPIKAQEKSNKFYIRKEK